MRQAIKAEWENFVKANPEASTHTGGWMNLNLRISPSGEIEGMEEGYEYYDTRRWVCRPAEVSFDDFLEALYEKEIPDWKERREQQEEKFEKWCDDNFSDPASRKGKRGRNTGQRVKR